MEESPLNTSGPASCVALLLAWAAHMAGAMDACIVFGSAGALIGTVGIAMTLCQRSKP